MPCIFVLPNCLPWWSQHLPLVGHLVFQSVINNTIVTPAFWNKSPLHMPTTSNYLTADQSKCYHCQCNARQPWVDLLIMEPLQRWFTAHCLENRAPIMYLSTSDQRYMLNSFRHLRSALIRGNWTHQWYDSLLADLVNQTLTHANKFWSSKSLQCKFLNYIVALVLWPCGVCSEKELALLMWSHWERIRQLIWGRLWQMHPSSASLEWHYLSQWLRPW